MKRDSGKMSRISRSGDARAVCDAGRSPGPGRRSRRVLASERRLEPSHPSLDPSPVVLSHETARRAPKNANAAGVPPCDSRPSREASSPRNPDGGELCKYEPLLVTVESRFVPAYRQTGAAPGDRVRNSETCAGRGGRGESSNFSRGIGRIPLLGSSLVAYPRTFSSSDTRVASGSHRVIREPRNLRHSLRPAQAFNCEGEVGYVVIFNLFPRLSPKFALDAPRERGARPLPLRP